MTSPVTYVNRYVNSNVWEIVHQQRMAKCIDDLEKDLILEGIRREISDEDLKKKLRGAVIKLNIGVNDKNLDELCRLAYLPSWTILKKSQSSYITSANERIRNKVYITSLGKQIQDASSSSIYKCEVSTTCNAIFLSMPKVRYLCSSRHNMMMSGSDQKQNSPDVYNAIPWDPEPQQVYNMRESEQMKLGIRNQVEDISENEIHLEEPSVHNVGLIYVPSSTYRKFETQQWVSKSENEQMTLGIINKLNNREGSTVLDGKQEIALSNHLEHLDNDHTDMDENCGKFNEPVQTVGYGAMHSHNDRYLEDTYRPCPDEHEEPVVDLPATERKALSKDKSKQEEALKEIETDNTNVDWIQRRAATIEIQTDDQECLVKESWQPMEELVENAKTDIIMVTIIDELGHEEHEETTLEAKMDDNKESTEHHSDREEFKAID